MNVEIKFGTRKELRAWLRRQKKSGNAVRYVAVDDPKTDQRVMLVLEDEALKVVRPSSASEFSQRESAESGTDRFPWWLPVVLAVIAIILGIVTIAMQGL